MADNRLRILATLDDRVSGGLDKIHDRFQVLGKSKGFQSVIQGVGLGAGISAYGMLQSAVGAVTDVIGDSIKAALADEESQNRLRASLVANVPAWDGNTDAIEKNILAKQRLGFSDETLRDSLTVLAGATHDVGKAQEIMNTAMDLARFKGIDLRTASEALIKVEAGVYRSLKGLGIVLRDGATQTEALAAVQAVARGQAEAYAQTNQGKLLASQIKVDEAMERFGGTIMPGVIDVLAETADRVVDLANALNLLQKGTADTTDGQIEQVQSSIDLANALAFLSPIYGSLAKAEQDLLNARKATAQATTDSTNRIVGDLDRGKDAVVSDMGDMGDAVKDFRDTYRDATGAIIRSSNKTRSALAKDAQGMIDDYFDPLEGAADLWDIRMQLLADKEALRKAKTAADSQRAKNAIVQDLDDEATKLAELGDAGVLTQGQIDQFERDAKANYASLSKDAQTKIDAIIARLRVLQGIKSINTTFTLTPSITTKGRGTATLGLHGHIEGDFDKGGTVPGPKGSPQLIVAHGGEYVVPNSETGGLRGPAMTTSRVETRVIQLVVSGRVLAEVIDRENGYAMDRAVPGVTR